MDWEKFWDSNAKHSDNEISQVQRKDEKSILLTAKNISTQLEINQSDTILDVCCGNGLLTNLIAKECKSIQGADFSQELINTAKKKYSTISFTKGNATELSKIYAENQFDKIYLQFSFQYFDNPNQGEKVISEILSILKPKGEIFIGDIPNHQKLWKFNDTLAKRFFYFTRKLKGKSRMGKFWKVEELDSICKKLNVNGKSIKQNNDLPYAHYRFDYLIEK